MPWLLTLLTINMKDVLWWLMRSNMPSEMRPAASDLCNSAVSDCVLHWALIHQTWHDVRSPWGMANLKESSQSPPGSSDRKLVFCHQASRCPHCYWGHARCLRCLSLCDAEKLPFSARASSCHTWPGQRHQELQRDHPSPSALGHQEL